MRVIGLLGICLSLFMAGLSGVADCLAQPSPDSLPAASLDAPEYTILQDRPDRIIAQLPNRLIVIAQNVPTVPVVSVQVWIKTGSIYEQEHVGAGLSHFLEHLLSGGTTSTTTEAQSNAILGQMGAQTNAATGLDTVRYYINTTSAHTRAAIDRLSDWMLNSLINQDEYLRERDVIQREIEMGQGDPGRIFWKLTQQARFLSHPARHPTIGYLDEFLNVSRDEIYDFYRRMYVPNNMVFVVVGAIDKQQVLEEVTTLWGGVPARDLPELSFPIEPSLDEPRTLLGSADIERRRVRLAWPGTQLAKPGDYALDVLAIILGQGEASRLVRTVRDQQRLVNNINASNVSFTWGRGFFAVECELADGDMLEDATDAIMEHIKVLRDQPVSQNELDRAQRQVLAGVIQQNQTAQGIASRLAGDVIGMADPDYMPRYARAIQAITATDLRDAANKFLQPDRLITVILAPKAEDESIIPLQRPEQIAGDQSLDHQPVDLDNRNLIAQLGENLQASGSSVGAIEVDQPVKYELPNGLRLIVQRSTVVPAVSMQIYWLGGLLGEQPGREGVAQAMAAMMMRGTQTRSAENIAQAIEDMGASLATASGNNTTYAQATALAEDWKAVLELMSDVLLHPSFGVEQWRKMQPRLLAAIDRQSDSWSGELRKQFREVYFGKFPWSQSPLGRREVVESLTVKELSEYHASHFGAKDTVIAVVGDVDPAQVRAQVQRLFGSMPSAAQVPFAPAPPPPAPMQIKQFVTQKPLAAIQIGFGPGLVRSSPDYPAMSVLGSVLSDFPAGWLEQQLRGQGPGLVYAVHGYTVTGLVPGYFSIIFNTQPSQAVEALGRAMSVIQRARTQLISQADLQRAKAKVLTNEFFSRQSNSSRAAEAALDELYGVSDLGTPGPPGANRFMQQVEQLTAADLQVVARKYLNDPAIVVISEHPIDDAELVAAAKL